MLNRDSPQNSPSSHRPKRKISAPVKITGIYLVVGFLWIFCSDRWLTFFLEQSHDGFIQLQTLKGWVYVLLTAIMLYWLVKRETKANQRFTNRLQTMLAELKQTEAALKFREEQLRLAFDFAQIGSWDWDVQTNQVVWNKNHFTLLGLDPEKHEATYQTWRDRVHPDDMAHVEVTLNEALTTQKNYVTEYRVIHPDNTIHWLIGKGHGIYTSSGEATRMIGVILDITDRKQSEATIQASERRFRGLVENASDIIAILDQMGNFCYASPSSESVLGYTNADVVGKNALDFVHPEDADIIVQTIQDALLQPGVSLPMVKYRVRHQNGRWRHFEAVTRNLLNDQAIAGIVVNCRDITDRELAEQALKASETRYCRIVEAQTDFVLRSTADTTITFANTTLCRALGQPLEQVVGMQWSRFVAPGDLDLIHQKIANLSPKSPTFENVNPDYRFDGQIGWTQWVNLGIFDEQGYLLEIQSVGRDITAQKQLELALRHQAERVELTSTIAQRIRQTLNLKEILNTTVSEIKQWLQCDRVVVYQFAPDMSGLIVAEAVTPKWRTSLGAQIRDTCFYDGAGDAYRYGRTRAINNIYTAGLTSCHLQLLEQFDVKANLVVPIVLMSEETQNTLWGLLVAHQCSTFREWHPEQLNLLDQIAVQLAIAIQQAQAFEQAQTELTERQQVETYLRSALAEKEVLLKEIHHRVKNNLQIVSGLLQLQAQGLTDPNIINALQESQSRIESMSLIHKKLYTSVDLGQIDVADYIHSLAVSLLTTYQISPGAVALNVNVESVVLSLDQAIPCGLIINELVSNALKHAFPKDYSGEINIKLCQVGECLSLTVQDNGVGLPEPINWRETQSLGLSLVHALATEQLDGELVVDHNGGMTFTVQFPNLYCDSRG
ncbi:PAS domain S-box protein [Oscillatoria sp. FACHB-1407]|uniref:PAS domain-containing sensor histidine kinase n=1 Tax=Oscillatoria sp. FACHB-1407 TaxID=2692847 RepID=UPI0016862812|nr:PAS domain S-box protein [Oscillatoria sp. FACHB-1407]MBD2461224.1 PAS domain S-box protein [Oscillatoria sp. FACHB-1407]